ncbi:MAG: PEP-CTERM sorting domain-containing protein [Planctomycetota bacterium]
MIRSTLLTAAAAGLFGATASAAIVDATDIRLAIDQTSRASATDPFVPDLMGDTNNNAFAFGGVSIGQRVSSGVLNLFKVGLLFDLPAIPAGQLVESATLRVSFRNENVFSGLYPDVSVFHSSTAGTAEVQASSLYEDASFADTGDDIFGQFDPVTTAADPYYTIDVTAEVLADYAGDLGSAQSVFRLEALDGLLGNPVSPGEQRYFIRSSANSGAGGSETFTAIPQLEVTFAPIPEPASLALAAIGGLAMLRRNRG